MTPRLDGEGRIRHGSEWLDKPYPRPWSMKAVAWACSFAAAIGLFAFVIGVALLVSGCCVTPPTSLKADRARYEHVGQRYLDYVHEDPFKTEDQKQIEENIIHAWNWSLVQREKAASE